MRVAFLGSGAFGLPSLAALAARPGVSLVGLVSQPDRPAGRGRRATPTPVAELAAHEPALGGLPLIKPADVNAPAALEEIARWRAEVLVVIAFGQKLGPGLLSLPGLRADVPAVNLHASLLPRWRGAAPINAALLAGDATTGNSVITIAPRMDAGLVLGQSVREIDPLVTAGELHDRLAQDGPGLLGSVLAQIDAGKGPEIGRVQDESLVTKARKLSRADDAADFTLRAVEVRRRVHGLTPWPGITIDLGGASGGPAPLRVKLLRVADRGAAGAGTAPPAGTLVDPVEGVVACGAGTSLRLLEVQPAGGRPMPWPEFVRGAGRALRDGDTARRPPPAASGEAP